MAFKDRFPLEIEFEIDREKLLRYLLTQARLGCFAISLPFASLIGLSLFSAKMVPYRNPDLWFRAGWLGIYMIGAVLTSVLFSSILYFSYFRPSSRLKAANLRLVVDGPYLRLVSGGFVLHDRRFHFRDVSSYSTLQGPFLRHLGLKSLCFRVSGHPTSQPLSVIGLADADWVRDTLCEIDASRELPDASLPDPTATDVDR
ncbi:PH domain-containing protein [Stieleria sp. TO1_6]|uniref:PH domain-containing protein n=1 Tax=Stieleria tagensis TaxID=2956795 RepID=UPI00209B664D|nr:PH domain-containing protein [Stieleria tagensis]MCO8125472.1 PH domain-containing protein [Stieleria tagensis]